MMEQRKNTGRHLLAVWAGMNTAVRAAAVLAALLLIGALCWIPGSSTSTGLADLFETPLAQSEVNRIRLALTGKNLTDFQIENNRLFVPAGKQGDYLQAIVDAGALPPAISGNDLAPPEASPFLSRGQQEQIQLYHRKQQLRRLILELPFVADATVQLDSHDGPSAFSAPDMRCVVSIRPVGRLILDARQLRTVHQNIVAAIAGIQSQQVVINDLNAGVAWDLDRILSLNLEDQNGGLDLLRLQRRAEHELQNALSDWPGIEVAVTVQDSSASTAEGPPVEIATNRMATTQPPRQLPAPGANSAARVPAELPVASAGSVPGDSASHVASVPPPVTKNLSVRLNVDNVAIDHYIQRVSGSSGPDNWWNNGVPTDSVALRDQIKEQLMNRVSQALDRHQQNETLLSPVSVHFCAPPMCPENALMPVGSRGINLGQGTVLAVASGMALCVLVVLSMNRRRTEKPTPPAHEAVSNDPIPSDRPEPWMDESVDGENRERIRKQIDELIDKNPEAAARVIQSWIRDAA